MPVEPLHQDLPGGRVAIFHPEGKQFPLRVKLEIKKNGYPDVVLAEFNPSSLKGRQDLEKACYLNEFDAKELISTYWTWVGTIEEQLKKEKEEPVKTEVFQKTPDYGIRQRTKHQRKSEASHHFINSPEEFLTILKTSRGLPDDTLLEWDKDKIDFCCVLDLDFHDSGAKKPTGEELERLGRELAPSPVTWWFSQGGGIKALYTATPNEVFTAQEKAAGAAAKLFLSPLVLRCKGTVEIDTKTRHPGARQNGRLCGALMPSSPDERFEALARFSVAEATDLEIAEFLEMQGIVVGQTLAHDMCLIDPQHESKSNPVYVGEDGLFCHSCASRLGRGFMSWGYVRRHFGLTNSEERSLSPIGEAVRYFAHYQHVDYLFHELIPTIPELFRRHLYKALLKKKHGKDTRSSLALMDFHFVRGIGGWLHADSLLPVGRALAGADVNFLPSCLRVNHSAKDPKDELVAHPPSVSAHTNNGRVHGWTPIQPYTFEPIFFHNNEAMKTPDIVRCYPKRRTTRERVSYIQHKDRLPLAKCEQVIEEYFPGVNMTYIKALIIAAGCAESGIGPIPMLWATGRTESAKTTTISIVLEMYGESFKEMSKVKEERLDEIFGESLSSTRLIVFDDFAKRPHDYSRLHTFLIRLNRQGHTFHKLYVGEQSPPVNSAVILTDWYLAPFFTNDPQFGRRVHLIRLENRLKVGWDKLGHFVEGWWSKTPELTAAARGLHSWIIDDYFPIGDTEPFTEKMKKLGIPRVEQEAANSDEQEAINDLVMELVQNIALAKPEEPIIQRRVGRGMHHIDWHAPGIGMTCQSLVDSLGKTGKEEDVYNIEHLKHVLDPYQLRLGTMVRFIDGINHAEFELKAWGKQSFIRISEGGKSFRSKNRKVNAELFTQWPPEALIAVPSKPESIQNLPGLPQPPEPVVPVPNPAVQIASELVVGDDEPVVILDPFYVYLDFETQSECEIKVFGSTIYAQHPSTKVMCAAISVSGTRIFWTEHQLELVMPPGIRYEFGIEFLRSMVTDPSGCIIVAHNMEFERAIWVYTLKLPEPVKWYDTMDVTLSRGLPAGVDNAGEYLLKLKKDSEGQKFIKTIWGPNKDTGELAPINAANIQRIIAYNFRDVDISQGIAEKEGLLMAPEWEQQVCDLHHKINFWGIGIDKEFARTLRTFDDEFKAAAGELVERVTGGSITRNDLTRVEFLQEQINANLPWNAQLKNMKEDGLEKLLAKIESEEISGVPWEVVEVIKCRLVVSRAALAKVDKALDVISADGRAKSQLRYWGASTARWSGYQVQPQNMKKPDEDFDLPAAIEAVERKDKDALIALCKDKDGKDLPPYELLGSLVRGILIPSPGSVYVVGDFASVEARGILYLAGDEQNLEEYRIKDRADEAHPKGKDPNVPDIYQLQAGSMFKIDPLTVSKKQRGGGKISILACGFQGGANAVERMAAGANVNLAEAGLTSQDVVDGYRDKHPKVKAFWYDCELAFKSLVTSNRTSHQRVGKIELKKLPDRVLIILPSGRAITYMNARWQERPRGSKGFGTHEIVYDNAVKGRSQKRTTYGGKIVENIVQGFCRDLLADAMLRIDAAGWPIAFHVHDEVIGETTVDRAEEYREFMQKVMRTPPAWAEGMPVFSKPEVMKRYGK